MAVRRQLAIKQLAIKVVVVNPGAEQRGI